MDNSKRLIALDVFRGLTVALMIVVNNPGSWSSVYPPLLHSVWSGCTPTDLVFPFFLFIIGAAMWYSYKKSDHTINKSLVIKILRRSLIIYLIGLSLNAYAVFSLDLKTIRIMGVMPRIAIAYCIASFIVLGFQVKWQRIIIGLILLLYWVILILFGGDTPFTLEGNFARTFDISVLGLSHIPIFHGIKFDQTGLLSTLPSIANVLFGYLAGRLIDTSEIKIKAVKRLLIYGVSGIVAALLWNILFPINKPLWTSSFVLYTCGFASLLLGILLWIIDIRDFTKWAKPFLVFGINPLFLYVFSEVLAITLGFELAHLISGDKASVTNWIYSTFFLPVGGQKFGSLMYAIVFAAVCWFAGWLLWRRKVIIKL